MRVENTGDTGTLETQGELTVDNRDDKTQILK